MALDNTSIIDAVGIEKATDKVVLSILDGWEWEDVHSHLLALQAKLNVYFESIEGGQLQSAYPAAVGRDVVIDVITRYPLHPQGAELLALAAKACADLKIEIRTRHLPGSEIRDSERSPILDD